MISVRFIVVKVFVDYLNYSCI